MRGSIAVGLCILVSACSSMMTQKVGDHLLVGLSDADLQMVEGEKKVLSSLESELKDAKRELERTKAEKKLRGIDVEIVESELEKAEIGYDLYRTLLNSELTLYYSKDVQDRKLKLKIAKRRYALACTTADYQSMVVRLLEKKRAVQQAKVELAKAKLAVNNPKFEGQDIKIAVSNFVAELSKRRVIYEEARLEAAKISEHIEVQKRDISNIEKVHSQISPLPEPESTPADEKPEG